MSAPAAVLLAALAGLLVADPRSAALTRLRRLRRPASAFGRLPGGHIDPPPWVARSIAVAAGLALVTGRAAAAAVLAGLAVALGAPGARRRREASAARSALARDLPRAADLTATCLDAGAAPAQALTAVADSLGGPLGPRLRAVSSALASGADLTRVDRDDHDPLAPLLRAVARASVTGAPLADSVRDVAADQREQARWQALELARRAGVQAVGPLAACFLPAFVLVGVVPVVVGVARAVLTDWG